MESKTEKEAQKLLEKFKEMKETEKELDKMEKDLRNIRGRVCRIQNEMNEIIESRTRRF